MNAAFFLKPKSEVIYLHSDMPLAEALEELYRRGYTSVPVIDREGKYICSVSEGDFLRALARIEDGHILLSDAATAEMHVLGDILRKDRNPSCHIDVPVEELLQRTAAQNFVPIVDDRGIFIGIVTRRTVIHHFLKQA